MRRSCRALLPSSFLTLSFAVAVAGLGGCGGKVGEATALDGTSPAPAAATVPTSAIGGACVADVGCVGTALCAVTDSGSQCGTCVPGLGEGDTCSVHAYDSSQRCQKGTACVGNPGYSHTAVCERMTYLREGDACDPVASSPSYGDVPPDSPPVLVECTAPLTCIAGTCGVPHDRPLGGACDTDDDCAGGLFCPASTSSSAAPSVCMPKLPTPAICDHDQACLSGLCCSYGPCAGETFRCIERAGLGEPCFGGDWCKAGLACNDAEGVCVTRPALGAPCDPQSGDVVCVDGAKCDSPTRTCVSSVPTPAAGVLGAPCTDATPCMLGLACAAGICSSATDYCDAANAASAPTAP